MAKQLPLQDSLPLSSHVTEKLSQPSHVRQPLGTEKLGLLQSQSLRPLRFVFSSLNSQLAALLASDCGLGHLSRRAFPLDTRRICIWPSQTPRGDRLRHKLLNRAYLGVTLIQKNADLFQ